MQNRIVFCALALSAILTGTAPAISAGAVAVGEPANIAKDGVSIGYNVNSKTADEAKAQALAKCKSDGSAQSKVLCKIVATLSNQCIAEALDPQAGDSRLWLGDCRQHKRCTEAGHGELSSDCRFVASACLPVYVGNESAL